MKENERVNLIKQHTNRIKVLQDELEKLYHGSLLTDKDFALSLYKEGDELYRAGGEIDDRIQFTPNPRANDTYVLTELKNSVKHVLAYTDVYVGSTTPCMTTVHDGVGFRHPRETVDEVLDLLWVERHRYLSSRVIPFYLLEGSKYMVFEWNCSDKAKELVKLMAMKYIEFLSNDVFSSEKVSIQINTDDYSADEIMEAYDFFPTDTVTINTV